MVSQGLHFWKYTPPTIPHLHPHTEQLWLMLLWLPPLSSSSRPSPSLHVVRACCPEWVFFERETHPHERNCISSPVPPPLTPHPSCPFVSAHRHTSFHPYSSRSLLQASGLSSYLSSSLWVFSHTLQNILLFQQPQEGARFFFFLCLLVDKYFCKGMTKINNVVLHNHFHKIHFFHSGDT